MTAYALRLQNSTDTAARVRMGDLLGLTPSGNLSARGGIRRGLTAADVAVTAGTMNVTVQPFLAFVDGGVSDAQGGYPFVSDSVVTLTLANGHASLSRTDVVAAVVQDSAFDTSGALSATVEVIQGTPGGGVPAMPTNALPLRNIVVPAGASVGTGGLTSGALSTDRRTYVSGLGGVVTVASQAERDALPAIPGTVVYRTDTDRLQVRRAAAWQDVTAGSWSSFTPTVSGTGTTQGNITYNTREYVEDADGNVDFYAKVTLGTTTVLGSLVYMNLPVALLSTESLGAITVTYNDASGSSYAGSVRAFDTAKVLLYHGTTLTPITSTVPFTWTSTDSIEVRGRYRRA